MRDFLFKLAANYIERVVETPPIPSLTPEQERGLFSELYQNPTFRKYLAARERYLIDWGMERFIAKDNLNADMAAGQLLEIRNLRERTKTAYAVGEKIRTQKLSAEQSLEKVQK